MERAICGFHIDERDDWVAELDCYHNQHVRHKPPFFNRPWVKTAAGREDMIGEVLDCVRCDRFEFPPHLVPYKRTPVFNEHTIPAGLIRNHSTKTGVWGRINVISGSLHYEALGQRQLLTPDATGVVVPCMLHNVAPCEEVTFYVEFFHRKT